MRIICVFVNFDPCTMKFEKKKCKKNNAKECKRIIIQYKDKQIIMREISARVIQCNIKKRGFFRDTLQAQDKSSEFPR